MGIKIKLLNEGMLNLSEKLSDEFKESFYKDYLKLKLNNTKLQKKYKLSFTEMNLLYNILVKSKQYDYILI
jgi:hypothetical protein